MLLPLSTSVDFEIESIVSLKMGAFSLVWLFYAGILEGFSFFLPLTTSPKLRECPKQYFKRASCFFWSILCSTTVDFFFHVSTTVISAFFQVKFILHTSLRTLVLVMVDSTQFKNKNSSRKSRFSRPVTAKNEVFH